MLGIRRLFVSAAVSFALVLGGCMAVSAAGNPGRVPLPTGDLSGPFCGDAIGTVLLHAAINNEYLKTFTLQDGTVKLQVNGRFVTTVTGNGKTLTFNSSGPGAFYFRPDGSVIQTGLGRVLFIGAHGEGIWLYTGNLVVDPLTGLLLSHSGGSTDICALLK